MDRSGRLNTLVVGGALLALTGLVASWFLFPPHYSSELYVAAGTLFVISTLSALLSVKVTAGGTYSSMDYVVHLAAIMLIGPTPTLIITVFTWFVYQYFVLKNPLRKVVYNTSQVSLAVFFACLIYAALGGTMNLVLQSDSIGVTALLTPTLVPFAGATVVYFAVNYTAVAYVISIAEEKGILESWRNIGGALVVFDLAMSFLAYLVVILYLNWGPVALSLSLIPLIGLRYTYGVNIELKQLNSDLLRVLVKTIEAQDPYTSGHSIRVAEMAKDIAREIGLRGSDVQRVETASLLHDIGKIGNAYHDILQHEGELSAEQRELIQEHPVRGVEIVESVRSLHPTILEAIRHHHERYDGDGYPDGLEGEAIPLVARIIMVADTVDAMTTSRPYRDALPVKVVREELREESGTQFDPQMVKAALAAGILSQPPSDKVSE